MSARLGILSGASLLVLAAVGILGLAACGGSGNSTTVSSVNITPTAATTPINTQTNFFATVTLTDSTVSTTTAVTWEVNGVAGNGGDCGSIVPSTTDQLVGVYTAPAAVPTSSCGSTGQLGQVAITAVAQQSTTTSGTTTTGTVTSNVAFVTVGVGTGLAVSPTAATVSAGGSQQFAATLNSVPTGASWTATSADGGNIGSINAAGLFTAPDFPPPGGMVTITANVTASDGTMLSTTAIVTVQYGFHSLNGPYAFSYTGNDQNGFLAAAGSFVADGNGHIISGVEDVQSFLNGVSTAVAISNTSTYSVGPDGRGIALFKHGQSTDTVRFVLTTNQHARMTRFDINAAGGGTIDQQSLDGLTNSTSVISGRYAFSVLGLDASPNFNPLGMAGEFGADGAGNIPNANAILDVNDNGIAGGTVTRGDTSLTGTYAFDSNFPGTGRGTISLTSATTGANPRVYAFYVVGTSTNASNMSFVSQLHLVEIDNITFTAGDMFLATAAPGLASANYVFTGGGNSVAGAYAMGGVFTPDGISMITGGVFDANNAGTYNSGPALGTCAFTSNPNTGRFDLELFTGAGACPGGAIPNVFEFAAYPTSLGSVVMLELDSSAVSTGLAYQQCGPQSAGCAVPSTPELLGASFAMGLTGEGLFHSPPALPASYQPSVSGQIASTGTSVSGGNLDINNFSAVFPMDLIGSTGSSIVAPAANGRGTATLAATNPVVTYNLVYYLIDDDTALLFSSVASPVAIGAVAFQF
jgi:hypothetical protein